MKRHFIRCGNFRILLLLCLVASANATIRGDILRGRVIDSETREPLMAASVEGKFSRENVTWIQRTVTDSLGYFLLSSSASGSVRASMLGYYPKTKMVMAFSDSDRDTVDVGIIELKMSEKLMKALEVEARARRFTVKGDTIVFHPEAFHLQEGARLDELIRQLPGVEVADDGSLTWNGKPIRITMDGESLFGGSDLVKTLPAEAVENIKAYNKTSEFSERTRKDDGTQDMVLDLTIKPGFLDRWYGDVKAAYQTLKHYDTDLNMHRLSKTDPVMIAADANNINTMKRRYMGQGQWMGGRGNGQEQGGSAGYQHYWNRKDGTHELKSLYNISAGLAHDDKWNTTRRQTDNYFPDVADTRIDEEDYQRSHMLNPYFGANLRWAADSMNTYYLNTKFDYKQERSMSRNEMQESAGISQLTDSHSEGHTAGLELQSRWEHYVKDGSLGASASFRYKDGEHESWAERSIAIKEEAGDVAFSQFFHTPISTLTAGGEAHYKNWFTKNWLLETNYTLRYQRDRSTCDFLQNSQPDAANSYSNHYHLMSHALNLSSTFNLKPLQLVPRLSTQWQRESQDYKRGLLDTAAVRRRLVVEPSLHATWKFTKTIVAELDYSLSTSRPELLQTLAYRDETNPLYITEGNPELKDAHTHDVSLNFSSMLSKQQLSLSATIGYKRSDRETINALSYNPSTAVYFSRAENVCGSRQWHFRLDYDQALGSLFRLQNKFSLNADERFGLLTAIETDPSLTEKTRSVSCLSSLNPTDRLTLSLDLTWLKASAFAAVNASRIRYSASPEQNTTHWNNDFGLTAEVTKGNFVFSSDITERVRRGYVVASMNHNMLLWNASITWKMLKNKGRLHLGFNDILNDDDNVWSSQSASQQVTTWYDYRHHYLYFSFTYHLDAKGKS